MATHKSAEKRNRQNIKLRERNKANRSAAKTMAQKAVDEIRKDAKAALGAITSAISVLAKTAHKGSIPKKRAARKASRLMKARNKAMGSASARS